MKNVKSTFIVKKVFSIANEKVKLELIKYNKRIQNILNIKLLNYKLFSGKYIIYSKKGVGKEYNAITDNLIYEGEYLNGKRNGKGKEYNFGGKLIFEGEYLNGIRNGKGKEYEFGELVFEGEYLNGERNGKGKEYGFYGELKFEGEYLNGRRNGKGIEYNITREIKFEGKFLNGKKIEGKGYNKNGDIVYEIKDGKGYIKYMMLKIN